MSSEELNTSVTISAQETVRPEKSYFEIWKKLCDNCRVEWDENFETKLEEHLNPKNSEDTEGTSESAPHIDIGVKILQSLACNGKCIFPEETMSLKENGSRTIVFEDTNENKGNIRISMPRENFRKSYAVYQVLQNSKITPVFDPKSVEFNWIHAFVEDDVILKINSNGKPFENETQNIACCVPAVQFKCQDAGVNLMEHLGIFEGKEQNIDNLNQNECEDILSQALAIIWHLSLKKVHHNDLKLDNWVYHKDNNRLSVIDFDRAVIRNDEESAFTLLRNLNSTFKNFMVPQPSVLSVWGFYVDHLEGKKYNDYISWMFPEALKEEVFQNMIMFTTAFGFQKVSIAHAPLQDMDTEEEQQSRFFNQLVEASGGKLEKRDSCKKYSAAMSAFVQDKKELFKLEFTKAVVQALLKGTCPWEIELIKNHWRPSLAWGSDLKENVHVENVEAKTIAQWIVNESHDLTSEIVKVQQTPEFQLASILVENLPLEEKTELENIMTELGKFDETFDVGEVRRKHSKNEAPTSPVQTSFEGLLSFCEGLRITSAHQYAKMAIFGALTVGLYLLKKM